MTSWPAASAARASLRLRRVPVVGAAICVATIVFGLGYKAAGGTIGTRLPPFFVWWDPSFDAYGLLAAAALAGGVSIAPRLLGLSPLAFGLAVAPLALALRLTLATASGGTQAWSRPFDGGPLAHNEYLPALPALDPGVGVFLDSFAQVAPSLPIHPSAHPPGTLLLLKALGIASPGAMAALVVIGGALSLPLAYAIGCRLLGDRRGRIAALLFCFAPSSLLYGATSADALFVTFALAAAAALIAPRRMVRRAGAVLLFIASFFSYALLAAGAWAWLVVWMRDGRGAAVRLAAESALVLTVGYALLYAATGFDLIATLATADDAYRRGIASIRPYAFWLFGSPVAFLVAAGLPLAWLALRALGQRRSPAVAVAGVVATAAVLGFTKAETERIWLFLVPLLCVAAASVIPNERLGPVLRALAAQALAVELLLETFW